MQKLSFIFLLTLSSGIAMARRPAVDPVAYIPTEVKVTDDQAKQILENRTPASDTKSIVKDVTQVTTPTALDKKSIYAGKDADSHLFFYFLAFLPALTWGLLTWAFPNKNNEEGKIAEIKPFPKKKLQVQDNDDQDQWPKAS